VKRSNRLVILVGVLLAVAAFVAIVILLNQDDGGTGTPEAEVTETVLVTTEDIEIGEPLTPDKVEPQEVPPDAVLGTPLRDPSQLNGRPALFAIAVGTQVTLETIGGGTGPENIAGQLQPGEKAVAVRLDPQTGVNFLAQPGDYVDLVISSEVSVLQPTADSVANPDAPSRFEEVTGLEGARTVKTVLQDKRVLYVSGTTISQPAPPPAEEDGAEPTPAPAAPASIILVFAGTDQDAEIVKFVQRDNSELSSERTEIPTSISVVIRSAEDDALEDTTGITIDQLVEAYGVRVPGIVEQLNEEGPAQ
jgi:Flp pilus assembly protein CpaB